MSACPAPALSLRPTSWGRKKVLYGRYYRFGHKYAYCNGDPIGKSDPSGLSPLSGANARIDAGMSYYGRFDPDFKDPSNCEGDTLQGIGLNPSGRYRDDAKDILANYKIRVDIPSLQIGDIVQFGGHWGTVVDIKSRQPIVFGLDGNYGVWAGTLSQYGNAQMNVESIYRVPGSGTSNSQVAEYHRLESVMPGGKLFDGRADTGKR